MIQSNKFEDLNERLINLENKMTHVNMFKDLKFDLRV